MLRPIRILELRSVRGVGGGPDKTILLGAAAADPARYRVTACYLRQADDELYAIDARAARLGIDYVEVRERSSIDPGIWPTLRQIVRSRGIDIVHAHDYKTDLLALLLARAERVQPLTTVHGWSGASARERRVYYPADKRLLRWFPRVIAVSTRLRDELVRTGTRADRITVLLNGIDPRTFRRDPARTRAAREALGLASGTPVVGGVGRLEREKRFDLLVDAFGHIRARYPDARLLIAGEGSERAALEAQIADLGLGAAVRLVGQHSDIVGLHHALDLYVQSSDTEGTPNAVLEAMAMETPVVATDVGGTRDLLENGRAGRLVPRGDAAVLGAAMADALLTGDRDGVARARKRVEEELSFERRVRRLEAVYDAMVERRPAEPAPWRMSRWVKAFGRQ